MTREAKSRLRFPKAVHLRRPEEFAAVKRNGVRVRQGAVAIGFLAGERRRLGIVASRTAGPAVVRNRLKRVVREFFRLHRERFPQGDCVVIPGAGAAKLTNDGLRDLIAKALARLVDKGL